LWTRKEFVSSRLEAQITPRGNEHIGLLKVQGVMYLKRQEKYAF